MHHVVNPGHPLRAGLVVTRAGQMGTIAAWPSPSRLSGCPLLFQNFETSVLTSLVASAGSRTRAGHRPRALWSTCSGARGAGRETGGCQGQGGAAWCCCHGH